MLYLVYRSLAETLNPRHSVSRIWHVAASRPSSLASCARAPEIPSASMAQVEDFGHRGQIRLGVQGRGFEAGFGVEGFVGDWLLLP